MKSDFFIKMKKTISKCPSLDRKNIFATCFLFTINFHSRLYNGLH